MVWLYIVVAIAALTFYLQVTGDTHALARGLGFLAAWGALVATLIKQFSSYTRREAGMLDERVRALDTKVGDLSVVMSLAVRAAEAASMVSSLTDLHDYGEPLHGFVNRLHELQDWGVYPLQREMNMSFELAQPRGALATMIDTANDAIGVGRLDCCVVHCRDSFVVKMPGDALNEFFKVAFKPIAVMTYNTYANTADGWRAAVEPFFPIGTEMEVALKGAIETSQVRGLPWLGNGSGHGRWVDVKAAEHGGPWRNVTAFDFVPVLVAGDAKARHERTLEELSVLSRRDVFVEDTRGILQLYVPDPKRTCVDEELCRAREVELKIQSSFDYLLPYRFVPTAGVPTVLPCYRVPLQRMVEVDQIVFRKDRSLPLRFLKRWPPEFPHRLGLQARDEPGDSGYWLDEDENCWTVRAGRRALLPEEVLCFSWEVTNGRGRRRGSEHARH